MAVIDHNAPPPEALRIAWRCNQWNTLPDAGGYLDQKYALMHSMTVATNVYNTVMKARNAQGSQIHNLTVSERRILKPLIEGGYL